MMFSKINELNKNDSIFISDLNKKRVEYVVYDKYTAKEKDLNCLSNTNKIEITLVTCNNSNNKKREILKAVSKDV